MKNTFAFDVINIHSDQPRSFTVRFDKQIIANIKDISQQETIKIEFDDKPGDHLLELILIDTPNSQAKLVIGNFKLNHYECVDYTLKTLFRGPAKFDGSLQGLVKFQLPITTPILRWQQKTKIY